MKEKPVKSADIKAIRDRWAAAWPEAVKIWNPYVALREPEWCMSQKMAEKEGLTGSFAMIRLTDHRIVIDIATVQNYQVENFALQVLAHEIGHNKKRHIVKMLVASALGLLVALAALAWLAGQPWFPRAFGFASHDLSVTFLLFGLLGGTVTYWLSPVVNLWLRRNEYEVDAFAATAMSTGEPLIGALRKLSERNLANLTPHPIYSAFHYSHPTLLEREQALRTPSRRPPQPGNET